MGLFKIIKSRVSTIKGLIQAMPAIVTEYVNGNILPINTGFITLMSKDYLRGYPSSFYLFYNMPDLDISLFDLLTMDKKIVGPIIYQCVMNKADYVTIKSKKIAPCALFQRIKKHSINAKLIKANVRCLGEIEFVQDDNYVYETHLLSKFPIESFYNIFDPKNTKDITESLDTELLLSLITNDKKKAKEDFFDYADCELLDKIYNNATNKDMPTTSLDELRKAQVDDYFNEMEYEVNSGMKKIKL